MPAKQRLPKKGQPPLEPHRIAIIEDEPDIREMIEHNLSREGFDVAMAADGEAGLELVQRKGADLVLLDLLLPGLNGIEVCRRLKADAATRGIPVIIVSAKGEESDIVLGLGVGADDYVTKPFSPRELIARVRAVLRRGTLQDEEGAGKRIEREGLVVDPLRHEVRVDGLPVDFTATEFRLLHRLASHPGRVFTREQLLDSVIGDRAVVIERNIDVHVRAIRKKLANQRNLVVTIRGVGYRFRDQEQSA